MEEVVDSAVRIRMGKLRVTCEKEISIQNQKSYFSRSSLKICLETINVRAQEVAENEAKLQKVKGELKDLEGELEKTLSDKSRKEAKQMAILDSILSIRSRSEELRKIVQEQKNRRDEYTTVLQKQSAALEKQEVDYKGGIKEAIEWYKKAMGFRIECGRGVKFIFNNINPQNRLEEYSFTIRYENDTYSLMECKPYMNGVEEMMQELNNTNGLFKFVRIMRNKFHDAALGGWDNVQTSTEVTDRVCLADESVEEDEGSVQHQKWVLRNRRLKG